MSCFAVVLAGDALGILPWAVTAVPVIVIMLKCGRSWSRSAVFCFGMMGLFQSATSSAAVQAAFLVLALLMAVASARAYMNRDLSSVQNRAGKIVTYASATVLLTTLLWLAGAAASGIQLELAVRDSAGYFLLAAAPVLGFDLGTGARVRELYGLVLAVSLTGAAFTAVSWLSRRGVEGFESVGLASSFSVYPALILGLANYFGASKGRIVWLLIGLLPAGVMLIAGGRQAIVVVSLALVVGAMLANGDLISRLSALVRAAVATVVAFLVIIGVSDSSAGGLAANRFSFWQRLFEGGAEVLATDQSAMHRRLAYEFTADIWRNNFWLGQGFGAPMRSVQTGLLTNGQFTVDSPLVVFAKFGLIGSAALIGALVAISFALRLLVNHRVVMIYLAVAAAVIVAGLANGFPTENRGFPIFVCLFTACIVAYRSHHTAQQKYQGELGRRSALAEGVPIAQRPGRSEPLLVAPAERSRPNG